jgi:O-acetyl-ADP-ribose deacetylase (regulator of RNase III)
LSEEFWEVVMAKDYRMGHSGLSLVVGDICRQATDAIGNAANGSLLGGGGVDGAIHRAAGPELIEACRELRKTLPNGRLEVGAAVITPGFRLPSKFVIHCVGPVYERAGDEAPRLLASCYERAIDLCLKHELYSVAFPSISTGIYGYPVWEAAQVAIRAVRDRLCPVERAMLVRFVLFDEGTYGAYEKAASDLLQCTA